MINTYHKWQKIKGFSTLMMTLVVLLSVSLLAFMSASSVVTHQSVITSEHQTQQSFNAAQAGLNYGIIYLTKNYSTIVDNETITGMLSNGSSYSVKFVFDSGKEQIQMESTGSSADNLVQTNIKQIVRYIGGLTATPPVQPLVVRGSVELDGNTTIENNETGSNVLAGGTISLEGSASTYLSGVLTSNAFITGSDISSGDASLSAMDNSELATTYLGQSIADVQSLASVNFTESADYNYATDLDGLSGETISINQIGGEASISGSVTVGTEPNPVNIVVDGDLEIKGTGPSDVAINGNVIVTGDLKLTGNVTINGLVLVLGSGGVTLTGNAMVNGGVISGGDATTESSLTGSSVVKYNSSILENTLAKLPGTGGTYNRIAGSWIDNKVAP